MSHACNASEYCLTNVGLGRCVGTYWSFGHMVVGHCLHGAEFLRGSRRAWPSPSLTQSVMGCTCGTDQACLQCGHGTACMVMLESLE